ncbi:MAG TPA: ATP-dependent DNA helicase RecG [Chloroflexota bacterium]|nr:ATP-dependent DNA helicase RecG [Chloroflexota bacterium]
MFGERMRKVLLHEQRTGFADRAAIGGLERFVRAAGTGADLGPRDLSWAKGALRELSRYRERSADERREVVERLIRALDSGFPEGERPPPPGRTPPRVTVQSPLSAKPAVGVRPAVAVKTRPRAAPHPVSLSPSSPITDLTGVGPKSAAALEKLGVATVSDLLYHLPRRHLDRRSIARIANLLPSQEATILASVWQVQTKRSPVQRRLITDAILQDETGYCHAVWFNQPYLARTLSRPGRVLFTGRVEIALGGGPQLASPEFEFEAEEQLGAGRLVPFYPKTEGLSDKQLRAWVRDALEATRQSLFDPVPARVREAEGLLSLREALAQAHFPDDEETLQRAVRRLAFDEFLLIQLGVLRRRHEWQTSQPGIAMDVSEALLAEFADLLPFELTAAQRRVVEEIAADMRRPVPMSRLLQGEVGSGKTVVAAAASVAAARNGYQTALMAPTEVLAQQHHRTMTRLLGPFGLRVGLVTGSQKKKEKQTLWSACRAGEVDVLLGTHALIQEEGDFEKLGLVIVDEQHRFGVRQRGALRRKGFNPDVLVMTATPIPRTLALSIYGDLDISVIDQLPPGRQQVKTYWVAPQNRHLAYEFVRKQVRLGRQAFIICPLVEDSEKIEARSAKAEHERLQRQFPDLRLALLHGRMPPKEKESVMAAFSQGHADVLVSTAVVEVGIDVPNATIMLIEGADRFGLSQLHQFRGRVGRGEHQSYCLLLSDSADAEDNPRLKVVVENHDGFALAEADLELRGPGEFFGTRQSGLPDLKVAKLSDVDVLEAARRQAKDIFEQDPELRAPEHGALAGQMERFWKSAAEAA